MFVVSNDHAPYQIAVITTKLDGDVVRSRMKPRRGGAGNSIRGASFARGYDDGISCVRENSATVDGLNAEG